MSLTRCLKTLKDDVSADDVKAIRALALEYREDGMDAKQAGTQAAQDHLKELFGEREALAVRIEKKGGKVPRRSEAVDQETQPAPAVASSENEGAPAATDQETRKGRIEDFGEKIEGARKDTFSGFRDALTSEMDVAAEPLSKSFPQPNYEKMAEGGVPKRILAHIAVMRDMIPSKPRKGYKLKAWADQVASLRSFSQQLLDGQIDVAEFERQVRLVPNLRNIVLTVDAIEDIAPADLPRAAQYRVNSSSYSMLFGETFRPAKTFWFLEGPQKRMHRNPFSTDPSMPYTHRESPEEAVKLAKRIIASELAAKTEEGPQRSKYTTINLYRDRATGGVFLGFKVRSSVIRLKAGFEDVKAAKEYLEENRDDLQATIDAMRKGPTMRGTENKPRSGEALREGDISPEQFSETFRFRGVQFGNYVEGPRRQADLNRAYDALMDLADALDIPPQALSLNGSLGLAFGARGKGGREAAAAHFEPDQIVINLTKGSGPGSLAHEWLHATDNYFARQDNAGGFMSARRRETGPVRDEVYQAWKQVEDAISKGSFSERSEEQDKARSKPYFSTTIEKAARSFERYIVDRLAEKGVVNNYLANIDLEGGAYPTEGEMDSLGIRAAYDNLFNVIETRETEQGVALFSLEAEQGATGTPADTLRESLAATIAALNADPDVEIVDTVADLPPSIRSHIPAGRRPKGVYHSGQVYLVAENIKSVRDGKIVLAHELVGHKGVLDAMTEQEWAEIKATMSRLEKLKSETFLSIADEVKRRYGDLDEAKRIKEIIAVAAERRVQRGPVADLLAKVREVLRRFLKSLGITGLFRDSELDIILANSERYLRGRRETGSMQADPLYMVAYHGTPHSFDRFSLRAIGTGEGVQAYGWGLYFAGKREIAEYYRNTLSLQDGEITYKGKTILKPGGKQLAVNEDWRGDMLRFLEMAVDSGQSVQEMITELRAPVKGIRAKAAKFFTGFDERFLNFLQARGAVIGDVPGSLYQVDIPEDSELLDWDAPLSEQPETVREALAAAGITKDGVPGLQGTTKNGTGANLYEDIKRAQRHGLIAGNGTDRSASKYLGSLGIPGLRYLDGTSRGRGTGTRNYVIWDENRVTVEAVNDQKEQAEALFSLEATATPEQAESEFAEENRRIREEDNTLWNRAKRLLRRQFTPGGLLPDDVFKAKIARDSQLSVVEFDVAHLIGELERAIRQEYGVQPGKLSEVDQRALSESLAGKLPAGVKPKTKEVLVAMRQYIDLQSKQYLQILREQVEAQADQFDDGERALLEAFLEAGRIEPASESRGDKAAATRRQNDLIDAAKEQAREVWGDGRDIRPSLERVSAVAAKLSLMETITANEGKYVHRSYQAFDDPHWFRKLDDEVLDKAREYLVSRMLEQGDSRADALRRARVVIEDIVKDGTAYDSMESFIKESKLGAKDLSVLKRRQDIAPEIRALLGEYIDPRINFAKSATKMGRLIWNQRFLDRVREVGMGAFLWTEEDRPPNTTLMAADGSEVYAPLNGLYTTREVKQAFQDALGREQMENWYRNIVRINGAVKFGKTVLSPTTAARNWQSAMFFAIANGHFDMTQMGKSISGLKEYFTHSGEGGKLKYLRRLKELGVVYDTPYAGEMMRLLDDSSMEQFLTGSDMAIAGKKALHFAQRFYQYGDDFWKIIGFENEKNLLMKHAGMSQEEAEIEAAERIRNTYPTYSMVGRGIQSLRRFPLAGTFVSFPAEIIRTSFNILRYAAKDMKTPGMRPIAQRRIFGMAIASSMAYALQEISKTMFDIDDDDEEAIRLQAAPWQQNSNLIFTGRDEKGNLQYIDISFIDPYNYFKRPLNAILRDQPWEDEAVQAASEMVSPFLGTDILAGTIFEILANKKDTGGEVFKETDSPARKAADIANHLRTNLQPGIASNLERTWKALQGEVSPSGKQYDLADEGWAWVGWRVSTLDPKTALYYRSFDFNDAKSDASRTLSEVLTNPNAVSRDDIEDAYGLTLKMRRQAYEDMMKLVNAARKSGLTRAEIIKTLRGSSISRQDILALLNGEVPRWIPTQQAERLAIRRAEAILGPEQARAIRERYRVARLAGINQ